jgi:hypothetical protein
VPPSKPPAPEISEIWQIYAISYDPDHFDESFDAMHARPEWAAFRDLSDDRPVRDELLSR